MAGILQLQSSDLAPSTAVEALHHGGEGFRSYSEAPLRKLTVDLIKTYRKINEVASLSLSLSLSLPGPGWVHVDHIWMLLAHAQV